jgi:hypothetical protein
LASSNAAFTSSVVTIDSLASSRSFFTDTYAAEACSGVPYHTYQCCMDGTMAVTPPHESKRPETIVAGCRVRMRRNGLRWLLSIEVQFPFVVFVGTVQFLRGRSEHSYHKDDMRRSVLADEPVHGSGCNKLRSARNGQCSAYVWLVVLRMGGTRLVRAYLASAAWGDGQALHSFDGGERVPPKINISGNSPLLDLTRSTRVTNFASQPALASLSSIVL